MMIRKMTIEDAVSAARIEKGIFSQPWSEHAFVESLQNENTLFLVAEERLPSGQMQIAGYVGMYLAFDEGEITNVAVDEAFRNKGIGQALVEELIAQASQKNICRIILEVRVSNAPAISLYKKMNFKKIGTRKNFYDFPKEDADIMLWEMDLKE